MSDATPGPTSDDDAEQPAAHTSLPAHASQQARVPLPPDASLLPHAPRPARASLLARVALAVGATGAALLAIVGAFALLSDEPVMPGLEGVRNWLPWEPGSEARDGSRGGTTRAAADDLAGGLYRVHADPLVSYVLKAGIDRDVLAGRVRSDELGLRARSAPPRGDDPLRIVLAGDSVAFGFGLDEQDSIAAQLEAELNAVLGPGARPVECRSVALPGWNHRNTVAAVLDHEDVLDPDIVVFMPIPNDVFDTDAMDETGHRRTACDPSAADPWLLVNQTNTGRLELESGRRLRAAGRESSWSTLGPQAISADVSPESMRRLDENAASLARLRQRMLDRGGHFLVAVFEDDAYSHHLLRRFDERFVPIDVVPLFDTVPAELKLPDDPHPNAQAASAMARWIAADLLARGWVSGAARKLPPVPPSIAAHRAPVHKPKEREDLSARTRRMQWMRLLRVIDLPAGDGCNQIYGGVYPDAAAGPHALFLLPRPARELLVQLAPLTERPDLLPLDILVQVDGAQVGTLRLTAADLTAEVPASARFELPPPAPDTASAALPGVELPMEVRLVTDRWAVLPAGELSVLAAYRVVRLEALRD